MDIYNEQQIADISDYVVDIRNSDLYIPSDTTETIQISHNQNQRRIAYLVVDTNFILSHLTVLSDLESLLHTKYNGAFQIVIPKQVVHELDGLKESKRSVDSNHSIARLARNAINWCYSHFHDSIPTVTGQRLHERVDKSAIKDNAILDCCLYFQNVENGGGNLVILMSDDKNLCVKSLVNNVLTVSYREGMTADLIAENVVSELNTNYNYGQGNQEYQQEQQQPQYGMYDNISYGNHEDEMQIEDNYMDYKPVEVQTQMSKPHNVVKEETHMETLYSQITALVLEALAYAVRTIYEDEMELVDYKESEVRNLTDAARCIIKYSFSIFGDFFLGRNNPMKTLDCNFSKYTKMPSKDDIHEVKDFVAFWGDFLDGIYAERPRDQKLALAQIKANWNKMVDDIRR